MSKAIIQKTKIVLIASLVWTLTQKEMLMQKQRQNKEMRITVEIFIKLTYKNISQFTSKNKMFSRRSYRM